MEKEKVVERKAERKEENEKEKARKAKAKEKVEKAKERNTEYTITKIGATVIRMNKIMVNTRTIKSGMKKNGMKSQRLNTLTCSRKNLNRSMASLGSPLEDDGARRRERELLLTRVCRPSVACLGSTCHGSQSELAPSRSR